MYKNNEYANYNDNDIIENFLPLGLPSLSSNNIVEQFWPQIFDLSNNFRPGLKNIEGFQNNQDFKEFVDITGNNNIVEQFWLRFLIYQIILDLA